MSGGNPSCRICSHGVAPLPFLHAPSTSRFRFSIEKLQLPPPAANPIPVFLFLSHRSRLKAFCTGAESPPPLFAPYQEEPLTIPYLNEPLTFAYLISSCGLSPDAALSVAKSARVMSRAKTPRRKNALAVVELLRSYGFSEEHVNRAVPMNPRLLLANPETTIKPKLEFLLSEGFSREEVADILSMNGTFFSRNLERGLVASYRFLSATIPSRSDVIKALKCFHQCLTVHEEPKLKILRDYGMPEPCILVLVKSYPKTLRRRSEDIEDGFKILLEMGMDPKKTVFCLGLTVITHLSREGWLRKLKLFQEMGWSESNFIRLFKRNPSTLYKTDEFHRYQLNYFKNMEFDQEFLISNPSILCLSMDERILPRVAVLKVLMSKGLIKNKWSGLQFYKSDKWFFQRYVTRYIAEVPDITKMYKAMDALYEN